jgi:hypothetical protein
MILCLRLLLWALVALALLGLSDKEIKMALSLNQAQAIVQKLSNEQLMQAYTSGTIPQFVVFSEMQRRQNMANSQAKAPTQTVAEKMIGSEEPEGIASMQPPQMAAKGGITKVSPLSMGYSEELPREALKIIEMRRKQMQDLEEPDYNPPQYAAEGGALRLAGGSDGDYVYSGDTEIAEAPVSRTDIPSPSPPPVVSKGDFNPSGIVSPEYIFNKFKQLGYSDQAAAALAGNAQHESYGNPRQKQIKGPGMGLMQWSPDRFNSLIDYANSKNINPYDVDTQIDFIHNELGGKEASSGKKLRSASSLNDANNAVLSYLRPKNYSAKDPTKTIHYNDRYRNAAQILGIGSEPPRVRPEGADTYVPQRQGAINPTQGGDVYYSRFMYPEKKKEQTDSERGLAALRAAQIVQSIGRPPMNRNNGGPIYLNESSDGTPVSSGEVKKTPFGNMLTLSNGEEVIIPPGMSVDDAKRIFSRTPTSTPGVNPQAAPVHTDSGSVPQKIYEGTKGLIGRMWDAVPSREEAGQAVDRFGSGIKSIYEGATAGKRRLESARTATPGAPYTATGIGLPGIGDDEAYQEEAPKSSIAGRWLDESTSGLSTWLKGNPLSHELQALIDEREKYETGLFEELTDKQREERAKKISQIDTQIAAVRARMKEGFEDPSTNRSMQPKPDGTTFPRSVDGGGPAGTEPPVPPQGIPGAPRARPPVGGDKGIPTAGSAQGGVGGVGGSGAGAPGGAGEDQSFSQVLKQVKDAIGSSVPDEMKEQMKQHQNALREMGNNKFIDAMLSAAKTLAGQRKGSVNFADAVANAGLAAQVAKEKERKAEDDMRKYRIEAIKLEQEGNKTAATQAMNYVIQANHDKRALQTAMMQTSKMIQAQEASDRRANIAASTKELVAAESKLADLNRMILNPQSFGITDTKALEIERDRLNQQIQGAEAALKYWQTGTNYDAVRAEAKRRGLI